MRTDKGDDGEAGNNEQQYRRLAQRLHRNGEVSRLDFIIRENAIAAAVNSAVVSKIEGLTMVCIQAVQETAPTQLLHSMRALNQQIQRPFSPRLLPVDPPPASEHDAACQSAQTTRSHTRRNYSMQRIGRKRARVPQCEAAAQHSDAAAAERCVELHLQRTAPRAAAYIRPENTLSIRKMLNSFDRITELIKRRQRVNDWLRRRL